MLRSMYSGISGMRNFQTKLDVVGNNIANVNTYGFKKGRVTFQDMMSQTLSGASGAQGNRGGINPKQVGLGATIATIDIIDTQSGLQTTGRSLDLALEGDGYFLVKIGDEHYYTRDGKFGLDPATGAIVNGAGLKVQAYKVDEKGERSRDYGDIMLNPNATLPAKKTENVTLTGNLSKDATEGSEIVEQIKVVDEKGVEHKIEVTFTKKGNGWTMTTPALPADPPAQPVELGSVEFDNNGKLTTTNPQVWKIPLPPAEGETTPRVVDIKPDVSALTGKEGASTPLVKPDGNKEGKLTSFSVGASGEISGVYSNGEVVTVGILAIAKFSNPSGLMRTGGNLLQESVNSGTPNIGIAGDGRGTIAASSLEMSNVDLSEEFTEMIVAQRGFQANTRIITTSDEILQELVNLKR
ncbi:flagellar hook protein FlgE [Bacillus chungangensis]|uniref:Flagellar hook protein FlgE n=1 Tax=Bacillus chungangensis TaxID=587633 RepID=A0ABT9WRL8_9BACI|nr:flagellar hook protein FlgE [Bacillus chungangensis]MDQ0175816.1 flagellar hook protein FlgE [Bacillus chungangensis]